MKNYVVINGVTYDLVERPAGAAVEEDKGVMPEPKLADIPVGETFKLGTREMIVLEHACGATVAICKDLLRESHRFGDTNDFVKSDVYGLCAAFVEEVSGIVGPENLEEFEVDLTSDDGLNDYGVVRCKAAPLTADQYRRYVYVLDKHRLDAWWWLATPWSTPTHDDSTFVRCVSPVGNVNNYYFCDNGNGVRPFCILKSDIFVSR